MTHDQQLIEILEKQVEDLNKVIDNYQKLIKEYQELVSQFTGSYLFSSPNNDAVNSLKN